MIIKDSIKYFMYKLGLRDTIPARIINNIEINCVSDINDILNNK